MAGAQPFGVSTYNFGYSFLSPIPSSPPHSGAAARTPGFEGKDLRSEDTKSSSMKGDDDFRLTRHESSSAPATSSSGWACWAWQLRALRAQQADGLRAAAAAARPRPAGALAGRPAAGAGGVRQSPSEPALDGRAAGRQQGHRQGGGLHDGAEADARVRAHARGRHREARGGDRDVRQQAAAEGAFNICGGFRAAARAAAPADPPIPPS